MKKVVITAVFAILEALTEIFKTKIEAAEQHSQGLLKAILWAEQISEDAADFAEGKEVPPIVTGISLIDSVEPFIVSYLETTPKAKDIADVMDQIAEGLTDLLKEVDPDGLNKLTDARENATKTSTVTQSIDTLKEAVIAAPISDAAKAPIVKAIDAHSEAVAAHTDSNNEETAQAVQDTADAIKHTIEQSSVSSAARVPLIAAADQHTATVSEHVATN